MEYFQDPRNQIQADIAYRLGMIAIQYQTLSVPAKEDFSVTLDVCILQNLVTTCAELLDSMTRPERKASILTADIGNSRIWGLKTEMIESTFDGELTGKFVLKRLRNALCHPTALVINDPFPSSGYATIPDGSKKIHQYCFVNSPDVRKSGHPNSYSRSAAERQLEKALGDGDMPEGVGIMRKQNEANKFCFGRDGKPFARIFKIILTVEEIHALVIGLSNHLAQPIQEKWDGVTIAPLVIDQAA